MTSSALRNRYVAFLDVLGFRDEARRHNFGETFAAYEQTLARLQEVVGEETSLGWSAFGDSVIVFTPPVDPRRARPVEQSFRHLVMACSFLAYDLLQMGLLVRGAVSYGPCAVSQNQRIVIGPAVLDAVELEAAQDWAGILLCPEALRTAHPLMLGLATLTSKPSVLRANAQYLDELRQFTNTATVPIKGDSRGSPPTSIDGVAIVPIDRQHPNLHWLRTCLEGEVIAKLRDLRVLAADPNKQRRLSATISFLQDTHDDWISIDEMRRNEVRDPLEDQSWAQLHE